MSSRKKKIRKKKPPAGTRRSGKNKIALTKNRIHIHSELNRAVQFHESGQLRKAEKIYRKILKINPNHPDCLDLLGLVTQRIGRIEKAAYLINRAIQQDPENPLYYNDLGNVLQEQGKLSEAICCYEKVLHLEPEVWDLVGAYYNMGNTFQKQAKLGEAISSYQKALQLEQQSPLLVDIYNNMGSCFKELEQLSQAVSCYQKVLQLKPDYFEVHNNLAMVLNDLGKHEEAMALCKRAIELKPDYAEAYCNLAIILDAMGKHEEAIASCRRAIELKQNFTEASGILAHLFEQTNRMNEAKEIANKALQLDSNASLPTLVVARLERREGNIKNALSRLQNPTLKSPNASIHAAVIYETGILYDRLGAYDKAFECFSQANAVVSQTAIAKQIDKSSVIRHISQLKSLFSEPAVDSWNSSASASKTPDPVFIVGFPRSGTTLLDQILGARPKVQTLEEKPLVAAMIRRFHEHRYEYPGDLAKMGADVIEDLRNVYFVKASEFVAAPYEGTLVDKLPLNIIDIGLIHRVFPKSKIIFASRHPYDVCLSCLMQNFKLNDYMVHFLELEDAAKLYDAVMGLWITYVNTFSVNLHVIKYEHLIDDFDKETKSLFNFLQIPWDQSVRDYISHAESKSRIYTPSYHQVVEPLYTRSMYRWRKYVEPLRPILNVLRPHVERFGYDLVTEI